MLLSDNEDYKKLLELAVKVWGYDAQLAVTIGECGEFLTEVGRRAQGRTSTDKIVDEIADVLIMMNQMACYHGCDAVRERVKVKMEKVRTKLEKTLDGTFSI